MSAHLNQLRENGLYTVPQQIMVWCEGPPIVGVRPGYWHHGVLLPNNTVIHLMPLTNSITHRRGQSGSSSSSVPGCLSSQNGNEHATGGSIAGSFSAICPDGVVERVSLEDFRSCGGDLNNMDEDKSTIQLYRMEYRRTSPTREIVKRATSKLGPYSYNLILDNCESFATWCMTGVSISMQVIRTIFVVGTVFDRNTPYDRKEDMIRNSSSAITFGGKVVPMNLD